MSTLVKVLQGLEAMRRREPALWYQPHDRGQRQFHESRHQIRCMFPGNRFGKSYAQMAEAAFWVMGRHPFQPIPAPPNVIIWIAPQYRQWEMLRPQFEGGLAPGGWRFDGTRNRYTWPNGSAMFIVPSDRDWYYLQGVNPDLVCCDEEPDAALWRELQTRQFGFRNGRRVRTRYTVAATATRGVTWMFRDLYVPWRDVHRPMGLDDAAATGVQAHPRIWCWPLGGIADNPMAGAEDVEAYQSIVWTSAEEQRVRMSGGFANWTGTKVFDPAAVAKLRAAAQGRASVLGSLRLTGS